MLLCPKCRRKLDGSEYVKLWGRWADLRISQIRCPRCGYYGLPIKIEKEGESRRKTQREPEWAQMLILFLFVALLSTLLLLVVNGLLNR